MKFCDECGATLEDDVWFCDECGANIEKPSEIKNSDNKISDKNIIENNSSRGKKRNYKNIILVIASMIIVSISSVFVTFAITNRDNKEDNTKVASVESEKKVEKEAEEITTEEVTTVEETTVEETTTEEVTTEEITKQEPTTEAINYYLYIPILQEVLKNNNDYNNYTIYDMNNDGVYELVVKIGMCEADYEWQFYTMRDNNAFYIGMIIGGHSALYEGENGSILRQTAHMGYEYVDKITYDGQNIIEEKILEREVSAIEEYIKLPNPLKICKVTDYSLIP